MTRTRFKRGEISAAVSFGAHWFGEAGPTFGEGAQSYAHRRRVETQENPVFDRPVLAVTGLTAEARVAAGRGIEVISSGGCVARLQAELDQAVARNVSAIISFGIAGGLAPNLPAGSALVARRIITENGERFHCDPAWSQRLSTSLGVPMVDIVGVDVAVSDPHKKRTLHTDTGASAVDMESHIAARVAHAHGLPFAAFRVVADPAERSLPHAAVVGMAPDGSLALGALLRSLLREPRQLPQLARTALDAGAAFSALLRGRKMIAGSLGFGDLDELLLDVPGEDEVCRPLPV